MARSAAWVAAFVLAVAVYVPFAPLPPEFEPDLSFRVTTHDAFARHLQIGRDIVSTYGPWGLLQRGYDGRTDGVVLLVSTLLACVFVWSFGKGTAEAAVLHLGILLIAFGGGDARFTVFALLLILAAFKPPDLARELPLIAALALVGQVKFSLLTFGAFVVIVVAVMRRRLVYVVTYAIAFLVAWIAAGQNPLGIPIFLARAAEIGRGYSAASALGTGIPVAMIGALLFVVVVAVIERDVWRTLLIGAFVAYLFKVGYVRADVGHYRPANALLLLLIIGYGFARSERVPAPRILLATATLIVLFIGGPVLVDLVRANASALQNRGAFTEAIERETFARSGAAFVPHVAGTIDAFPWESAALILSHSQYKPRPVFQSCMTWTPKLAELNAEAMRAPDAPQWLWATSGSIDEHLPLLDDSLAWREVMQRYDVASRAGSHLLLRKRTAPRVVAVHQQPPFESRYGERVAVPAANFVWCTIDVKPSIATRLREVAGRPPALWLETETNDGMRHRWRVPYTMLGAGFILSPSDPEELWQPLATRISAFRMIGDGFGDTFRVTLVEGQGPLLPAGTVR
jgi:hypothetical protein